VPHEEHELFALPEHMRLPPFLICLIGVRVVQCCQITGLHVFSSVLWCTLRFPRNNDVLFVFTPICYIGGFMFYLCFILYLFTYIGVQNDFHKRWYSCHLTRQMSHVEQELLTRPEHMSVHPSVLVEFLLLDV
jgi:hypothetical protein